MGHHKTEQERIEKKAQKKQDLKWLIDAFEIIGGFWASPFVERWIFWLPEILMRPYFSYRLKKRGW